MGASYEFVDEDIKNRKTYWYKLEDIDLKGKSTFHGPIKATPRLIYGLFKYRDFSKLSRAATSDELESGEWVNRLRGE